MAYQSEYALENEMMNQLEQLGYERVTMIISNCLIILERF